MTDFICLSKGINIAGLHALPGCLAEDVVYSLVRAQFAGSHITLVFMFVAPKGFFSE